MQLTLKSVLNFISKNKFFYLIFFLSSFSYTYSQENIFFIDNNKFFIKENNNVIFKTKFVAGICNEYDLKKSDFKNQFYLYIENTCTTTVTKQLFKINWENNKFRILSKEIIKMNRDIIFCKNIFYENFIIDSLDIDNIEKDEEDLVVNNNKRINSIAVNFNNKIIGYKRITSQDAKYNYPLIDNYHNVKNNIILYNDIAFILYKNKSYIESLYVLKKIIKHSPNRAVAYLNIADCYWALNQKKEAKLSYQKYLSLMQSQKKDLKKVPKRVYERIK